MLDAPCIIVTEDDLNAELAMIDENLCRTDMTLAERARIMVRRKELYEEKHPETRHGANQHSRTRNCFGSSPAGFAPATAAAIGKVERVVQLDVSRGTQIGEDALALVTRTQLDNARYLDTLKRVPKPEQVERVRRDLADPPARTKPTADYLLWIEEGQRWHEAMPYQGEALHGVAKTHWMTASLHTDIAPGMCVWHLRDGGESYPALRRCLHGGMAERPIALR